MDHELHLKLTALLLKVPDIEDYATRTGLLMGIPNYTSLARSQSNAGADISRLIDQLASMYLQRGQWALSLLTANALERLEHTTDGQELKDLYQRLLLSQHNTESTNYNQASREKIEIAVLASPKDTNYCQQIITALEGALQFLDKRDHVTVWHRGLIRAGSITGQVLLKHIQVARIMLLLMSPDFLDKSFYQDKNNHIDEIIRRKTLPAVKVIPVLIRPSAWKRSPFGVLKPLPASGTCLTQSTNRGEVLHEIGESVLALVQQMMEAYAGEVPLRLEPEPRTTEPFQEKVTMSSSTFLHGHALLIGIGGDLPVTVDDAQRLRNVLEHSARAAYPSVQIDTLLESNADRTHILAAFDRLIERVKQDPAATVIIYYSGHGGKFSLGGQSSEYFLIPHGYNPARRHETAISDHELTARIQAIQAQKLIVLLDCCHAGGIPLLKDGEERFEKSPRPPELFEALKSGAGRVVVASSLEGETSQTDSQGSIFTNCLLEALRGRGVPAHPDHAVRMLDVLSYLFKEVPQRAGDQQHPMINHILNMTENFVLCYVQNQMKEGPDDTTASSIPRVPITLSSYQRARLDKRRDELQSSLDLHDEKIARLNRAVAIEMDVLRLFQYQQQLLQELQHRTSIEEELGEIIRQLEI